MIVESNLILPINWPVLFASGNGKQTPSRGLAEIYASQRFGHGSD